MDDDALMRRVVARDDWAFASIVKGHQRPLTRFAQRILISDPQSAHDVVQEAFVRLWRTRAAYQPQNCLRSFLYRIVYNICLDYARKAKSVVPLHLECSQPEGRSTALESMYESRALGEAIQAAVRMLPQQQRVVFVLSQYEELSYQEIAAILDCPVGTVASRKRLAVNTLRRKLGPWMEDK